MQRWMDPMAERARLQAALARIVATRAGSRARKGLLAQVLRNRGVGDWEGAPRWIRNVAFLARLCPEEALAPFG